MKSSNAAAVEPSDFESQPVPANVRPNWLFTRSSNAMRVLPFSLKRAHYMTPLILLAAVVTLCCKFGAELQLAGEQRCNDVVEFGSES